MWVAVGKGTDINNTIAWSMDGFIWTGLGTSIFSVSGNSVCWTGDKWIATGTGTNTIATSTDGKNWTGQGTSIFSVSGNYIACNSPIATPNVDSQLTINAKGTLDIVSGSYYNYGYTNMNASFSSLKL
jgi:hypothetical protein